MVMRMLEEANTPILKTLKGNTGQKKCVTCYKCGKKRSLRLNQCYSKKELTFSLSKSKPFKFEKFFICCKNTESDKMAWPSVKTTTTPSHYAYIAVTLSFLFPPEVAESITRLTKKCDEAQKPLRPWSAVCTYLYAKHSKKCFTFILHWYAIN